MEEPTEGTVEVAQAPEIVLPPGMLVIRGFIIQPLLGVAKDDGEIDPLNLQGQEYTPTQARTFFADQWPLMFDSLKAQHAAAIAVQETEASVNNRQNRRARASKTTVVPIKAAARKRAATRKR